MSKYRLTRFAFLELEWEGRLLADYVSSLQGSLSQLTRTLELEIEEGFGDDEDLASTRRAMEYSLAQGIPTRYLTGTALVAICAYLEHVVRVVAAHVAKTQRHGVTLDDFRGGFVDQASVYFGKLARTELFQEKQQQQYAADLVKLRNIFAHAGGVLSGVSVKRKKQIEGIVGRHAGITVETDVGDEYLIVSPGFVVSAYERVKGIRDDLCARVATPSE